MSVAQNIYDDPHRTAMGLNEVLEQPALRSMLPKSLKGMRISDLGCGFGDFARKARREGACAVVGIDLSFCMLERAIALTDDPAIAYRHTSIEQLPLRFIKRRRQHAFCGIALDSWLLSNPIVIVEIIMQVISAPSVFRCKIEPFERPQGQQSQSFTTFGTDPVWFIRVVVADYLGDAPSTASFADGACIHAAPHALGDSAGSLIGQCRQLTQAG